MNERDNDDRWLAEFDRLKKAGKLVLDREEWKEKLEDAYNDGRSSMDSELTHAYANGRADEREQIGAVLKAAGFELRVSPEGHEFLLNVQDQGGVGVGNRHHATEAGNTGGSAPRQGADVAGELHSCIAGVASGTPHPYRDALQRIQMREALTPDEKPDCPRCKGSGEAMATTTDRGPDDYDYLTECRECGGTGFIADDERGEAA
jgi:DnaJ-class molecular chaperone